MTSGTVCQVCIDCVREYGEEEINGEDESSEIIFHHHKDMLSLQKSADDNCQVCSLLLRQVQALPRSAQTHTLVSTYLTELKLQPSYRFPYDGAYNLVGIVRSPETRAEEAEADFELFRSEDVLDYYGTSCSRSTASVDTFSAMSGWLEQCSGNHPECQDGGNPQWYPSRLLDVDTGESDLVRLVLSSEHAFQGGYVTLSHRWGQAVTTKLLQSNLRHLMSGIPLASLPLVYRQAVRITRHIKKRYLWIDSLCIFQDEHDKSDWLLQAGLMGKIYFHGFLNIAATKAVDSTQSLFTDRSPDLELRPSIVQLPDYGSEGLQPVKDFVLIDFDLLKRELTNASLNSRAWVLQERLLSHRVLHFGHGQLFWECKQGILCERFPQDLPHFLETDIEATFRKLAVTDSDTREHEAKCTAIKINPEISSTDLRIWSEIVHAYSQAQLTFHSDRVIALSGIAKALQHSFRNDYIAGMWRHNLEAQLLWRVVETRQTNFQPSTRPSPYRAPTWSWLSVEGIIDAEWFVGMGPFARVVDVSMTYQGKDRTGLIKDGSLTLRGRLRSLALGARSAKTTPEARGRPYGWEWKIGGKELRSSQAGILGFATSLDVPHADFIESNRLNELFFMSVAGASYKGGTDPPLTDYPYHLVLLLKCVDRSKGIFHRFGVANLNTQREPDIWSVLQEFDADEPVLPCINYDAATHSHTILVK